MPADHGKDEAPGPDRRQPSREELDALFARNLQYVRAFVRLRIDAVTRDNEAVSDVVQSACREVLANESFEFRGEVAFRSYLCQAALHKIRDRRRHYLAKKRGAGVVKPIDHGDSQLEQVYRTTLFDPARRVVRAEEIAQLEATFERLPEDYREALTLYRIVGLSVSDLARHLGRTEGAVKALLSRAMGRLSSLLTRPRPE